MDQQFDLHILKIFDWQNPVQHNIDGCCVDLLFNGICVSGPSHEADEGTAGEKQDERVSQEPRNCLFEEGPA